MKAKKDNPYGSDYRPDGRYSEGLVARKGWATAIIIVVSARVVCSMVSTTRSLPRDQRKSAVQNFGMSPPPIGDWAPAGNGARPWKQINQPYADRT